MPGEREWETGWPRTARRFGMGRCYAALSLPAGSRAIGRRLAARGLPCGVVLGDSLLELRIGGREEVAAAVWLGHVVEVVDVRRMRGRLEGRKSRIADRCGWQACVRPGVVGRIEIQLRLGERLRPVVLGETDRGVDPEWRTPMEAVVDHRRDELSVLVDDRLALDHRGDGDNVVGSQLLGLRVVHVHLSHVLLEGVQLAGDQVVDVRMPRQVVRGGKQEPLEARRVLRAVLPGIEPLEALSCLHVVARDAVLIGEVGDLAPVVALRDRDLPDPACRLLGRGWWGASRGEVVNRGSRAGDDPEHDQDDHRGADQPPAPDALRASRWWWWWLARRERCTWRGGRGGRRRRGRGGS